MKEKALRRKQMLVQAIRAAALNLSKQRLTIGDYFRLSELRRSMQGSGPRRIVAGWVAE